MPDDGGHLNGENHLTLNLLFVLVNPGILPSEESEVVKF